MQLSPIHTLAFAGVVLFLGYGVRRVVRPLARWNLPAPVLGGLLVALWALFAPKAGLPTPQFDTLLKEPLMIAFFTSIGFAASLRTLKIGGPLVLRFLAIAAVFAVVQNVIGILVALPFGLHPLFGVLCGAVTLTGGPATGLAFAPDFEKAGVQGAEVVAVASAMFGILAGGVVGGPIGTWLIEKGGLKPKPRVDVTVKLPDDAPGEEEDLGFLLLKHLVAILVCLWLGSYVSAGLTKVGVKLPAYIGAMILAAILRNLDDHLRLFRFSQKFMDELGEVALSLFIAMALMTLKLADLAGLVTPLIAILTLQILAVGAFASGPVHRWMGHDYDSAIMSSGFIGFMLGTTANAMANMRALTERYGKSPQAFLIVPLVGAFFIDFLNALLTTGCLWVFG